MKNSSRLFVGSLLLVFFTGKLANAAQLIDQEQPVIDTSVGGLSIGCHSDQKLAQ
jgi:hypothetical protein